MRKLNKIKVILTILLFVIIIGAIRSVIQNKKVPTEEASSPITELIEEGDVGEMVGDTSWDEENVEETKVEENINIPNDADYYIKVNYTANCVTIYKKDEAGKYTVPIKAMICSTGVATPKSGVYRTSDKYRWHELLGGVYGQYCTRITGHILFHSVPYKKNNSPDSLKYIAYDNLGMTASAGCVRLTVEDAAWIYNNCTNKTYVEFYSSKDPGPLGKPTAQKISSNTECRNWDPTDPDPRNPWK